MARTEKVNVRLTPAQIAALRKLATESENKELLGVIDKPQREVGVSRRVMLDIFKRPATTLAEVRAAFPNLDERRAKSLHKQSVTTIALLKSCNRWREDAPAAEAAQEVPAKKKAA